MNFKISYGGVILIALVAGCSSRTGPATASISGIVTLDGQPLEGVEVHFVGEAMTAYGKTDASGRYELVQGAQVGENKIYFSKIEGGNFELNPEEGMDEAQLQAMAAAQGGRPAPNAPSQVIPRDYSDPSRTKISFVVPDGGSESADFKLTSQ